MGGAIGLEGNFIANAPPKKKKKENPLKKELSNPQGLDFANQAGALMAQPQKVEMLPPKDITKESTRLEKATSGVKNESKKVLRTKANVFDPTHARTKKLHIRVWRYIQEPKILQGKSGLFSKNDQCLQGAHHRQHWIPNVPNYRWRRSRRSIQIRSHHSSKQLC